MSDDDAVAAARARYQAAVRAERLARIEAAEPLRRRARRRRAGWRLFLVAGAMIALAFLVAAGWALLSARAADAALDRRDAAQVAAAEDIGAMLTADPAHADRYVAEVLAVSTGEQRSRLERVAPQLREAVAGLGAPTTGRVVAAGVQGDPGDEARVLVVAQASAPELVGGDPGDDRVSVVVQLRRSGDRWLIADTEKVS